MPNGNGRYPGGEWGSRTPVESREKREAGVVNDVTVPILLSVSISAGTALVWLAWMIVVRILGDATFWLFSLLASSGLFFAPQLRRRVGEILGRRYSHADLDGLVVGTVGAGLFLTVLGAYLSVALWKVTRGLTWWQLLITAPAVGLPVGLLWLLVSTFQESFFRSPFLEQAMALLIHQEETPWYRQAKNRPEPPEPPRIKVEIADNGNGGGSRRLRYVNLDITEAQMKALARICLLDGNSFSEDNVAGSGKPFGGRDDYQEARQQMIDGHFLQERVPGSPRQGWEWTRAGKALLEQFLE
jgi:hypothetical protein